MYSELGRNDGETWVKETSNLRLFHPNGEGELIPFTPVTPIDNQSWSKDYPYKAILGSLRYHLGSGTRTGCSDRIRAFSQKGEVEISFEDGARLGIEEGDRVKIASPYGTIEREVKLRKHLTPGIIFIPKAFNENDVMNLIPLKHVDGEDSVEFKEVNVKIDKKRKD